ncbi:L-aspartate oxidase [candidate division WOR-3 bacterium]|nr:L-aspartate oxidase [candidate division WOR-3 bacterium]
MVREKIIVVGSGLAGLYFALEISRKYDVLILTKKEGIDANTNYAQGGIAAVHGKDDAFDIHFEDTVRVGEGLCREDALKIMVEEGPGLVRKLFSLGVEFSQTDGSPDLWLEGGHSRRRIWHAKDSTGNAIEKTLISLVKSDEHIELREKTMVFDLIIEEGICRGVKVLDNEGKRLKDERACAVMMASGGIGQVFEFTTNPKIATGDGIAMAFRAGATICNMEFIQFHPTSLYEENRPDDMKSFLISEAVRGEGAVIKSISGDEIMKNVHKLGSLAPRDVVARAIQAHMFETGDKHVLLDFSNIPGERFKSKFPLINYECIKRNVDLSKKVIPVVPAAHYVCGGIKIDLDGRTDIPALFASGEAAYSGVHGANRLASNSLLEALVFSNRAAKQLLNGNNSVKEPESGPVMNLTCSLGDKEAEAVKTKLQKIMWENCGIVRRQEKLDEALAELNAIKSTLKPEDSVFTVGGAELTNMFIVSELIAYSASLRKESRGLHYRKDWPNAREIFSRDTELSIRKEEKWMSP